MDTRFLDSLIAVVENGSIAQAARQQHLTPAAIGQRIQSLEREYGVALLNRQGHRAVPTEACTRMLPRARRVVAESRLLAADSQGTDLGGRFNVGAISTALTGILPKVVRALSEHSPTLALTITPGTSRSLIADLEQNRIDAAIVVLPNYPLSDEYEAHLIRREKLLCVSKRSRSKLPVNEVLIQNPYIAYDKSSWGGALAHAYLLDQSLRPSVLCELDALEAIVKLVEEGMGASLLPQWAGFHEIQDGLDVAPIEEQRYARKIALVFRDNAPRMAVINEIKNNLAIE
ncbi:MAG: LysR family transcriptional regulator [Pseudomonadota bacterium]